MRAPHRNRASRSAVCTTTDSVLRRALATSASAQEARAVLEAEGFRVDYVEEHWGRRFGAAFLDGIRLIDNVPIG